MGNTVFKKLMTTYVFLIVVAFLILGLLFSQLFGNYFFDRHERLLIEEGNKINELVIEYLNKDISRERLSLELQSVERFLNTRIWIIDKRGVIYGVSSDEKKWIGKQITTKELLEVLSGKVVVKKGIYEEDEKTPLITVGMPILVNGFVDNAIIMNSPLYEVTKVINEVHKIIWTAMGISFIISFILLWIASKKASDPLREMGRIASKLAQGDFSQRVTGEERKDEIGQVTMMFNSMADKLEKIDKNRRTFISAVAHELRSPMTLIKGFIQGIVDGTIEEREQNKYLNIILEETKRLNQLVINLLDIQKMESGQYPINPISFDICELIRRTLIKYEEEIEKRNIEVELVFEEDKLMVLADKEAIEQVLINLIDNAMKFMNENPKIIIKVKKRKDKVWITIKDHGIGIPKEHKEEIWKQFYKTDQSRDRNKKGTGLGLYIVKKILDCHNEHIQVESIIGEGTSFSFSLKRNCL
ncbi:HAMP domain-containing protein [Lutibacter sp. B2]|nr:HAMP domain-containing protein [Lutibacter sp. B2]